MNLQEPEARCTGLSLATHYNLYLEGTNNCLVPGVPEPGLTCEQTAVDVFASLVQAARPGYTVTRVPVCQNAALVAALQANQAQIAATAGGCFLHEVHWPFQPSTHHNPINNV